MKLKLKINEKKKEEIKGRNKVEWIRMELSDIEYSRLVI